MNASSPYGLNRFKAALAAQRRQVGFWAECFGEIGRATSRANEPADDFTTAEAQRRLAI